MKKLILTAYWISGFLVVNGQVPARQEPLHHNVLENSYVRLLDVRIPSHDTSMIHIHETPSIFVIIDNVRTGSQIISEGDNPAGSAVYNRIWFDGFTNGPRIHRVWNRDTSLFHVMDIELVNNHNSVLEALLPNKNLEPLFTEKQANGYLLTLNNHEHFEIKVRKTPMLIVVLDTTNGNLSINGKSMNKGDYRFIGIGSDLMILNKGKTLVHFGLFEIK